ncbi:MAG: tyrosine-protein phosphatase [Chloroflexota bacterium]
MPNLTYLPFDTPGKIYRSPMSFSRFDHGETTFAEYKAAGIDVVVMLTSDEEAIEHAGKNLRTEYQKAGIQVLYLPIIDFDVPKDSQAFQHTVQAAVEHAQEGRNLVVHCYAGLGRTGMFLGVMARRILGQDGKQAVTFVRKYIEGAIQTDEQLDLVLGDTGKKI